MHQSWNSSNSTISPIKPAVDLQLSTSASIHTFSSWIHISLIPSFIPSYLSLHCFRSLRVSHPVSVTVGEGWRKTQRDCIVVCSYLIINPRWSVSTPGPLFPFHSAAPSDKVAGWMVGGHGGFVFINNSETASSQRGWSYINHQQWQDGFDNCKHPTTAIALYFCSKLHSGALSWVRCFSTV